MNIEELREAIARKKAWVESKLRDWTGRQISDYYRERYPEVRIVSMPGHGIVVTLNSCQAYVVHLGVCDQYKNREFTFRTKVPPVALRVMCEYLEDFMGAGERPYAHRQTHSLLIDYWKQKYQQLSAEETMRLLEIADSLPSEGTGCGFRAWLTTSSYLSDGAVNHHFYIDWPEREKFAALLKGGLNG